MTENKRYYGVDEEEYGAYWILDISNCKKTKEDFLDENKEIYDLYAWEDYLNKCAKTLKKNEVVKLLNKLNNENQEWQMRYDAQRELYAQLNSDKNNLYEENKELKEKNEFARLLANHRGEMVSFANALIQDLDDEKVQDMWEKFKDEMYKEWKQKRGIE